MGVFDCDLCTTSCLKHADLKHHMISCHSRLRVVCCWCDGEERFFRRAVDLRDHIKRRHPSTYRETNSDYLGEPNCYYVAEHPRSYSRVITPTRPDSEPETFIKTALERWLPTIRNPSRPLDDWKRGWVEQPTKEAPPDRDSQDSPYTIHKITIRTDEVSAVIYREVHGTINWYDIQLGREILSSTRDRESLLRRLMSAKPFLGDVPATFGEVDSPQLPTLFRDMSAVLGVARSAITSIHHCEKDLYTRKRKCTSGDDEPPAAKSTSSTPPPTPGRITPLASPDINICISDERMMPPPAPAPTAKEYTVIHIPTPTMAGAATQILVEEQLRGRISTVADLGPQQQPPRTSHDLSSDPSSEMYEPTGNEGAYPTYQPTRKSQIEDRISNLVSRAESLLRSGGMPLIAPARLNWEGEATIMFPVEAPLALSAWPPRGWTLHSNDSKLLMWESAATAMAMSHHKGSLDREDILDEYNFLALPGTANPKLKTTSHNMRYFNFKLTREIALGRVTDVDLATQMITQLEAARDVSVTPPTCKEILTKLEKEGVRIRIS